jgi:hypothetical protein
MAGVDPTLRMHVFHGAGMEDPKQHLFICETTWIVKTITYDDAKIAQLEMTFKYCTLLWHMKYHITTSVGKTRTLAEVSKDLLKEF